MEHPRSTHVADTSDGATSAGLREKVEARWDSLSRTERKVGEALLHCPPEKLVFATADDIARLAGTSDASVVRTARRLGYSGLPELKREVGAALTRAEAPQRRLQQRIAEAGTDLSSIAERVILDAQELLSDTQESIDFESLARVVAMIAGAEDVIAYGIGGSELAARHLSLKLTRLGHRARFIGTTGFRLADELLSVRESDVVVIFAPGRLLSDVYLLLERAQTVGAGRVLVSERSLANRIADQVDETLLAPQSPGGSTAEALSSLVVTDILLLAVASVDEPRALYTSDLLSTLRSRLLQARGDQREP